MAADSTRPRLRRRGLGLVTLLVGSLLLAACRLYPPYPGAGPGRGHEQVAGGLPVGPVSHHGRWLTDATGRVLLLHGVNMVAKQAPYEPSAAGFDDADAAWLAANGFDVVRLGVMATGLEPSPGHIDRAYLDNLARTVRDLARHHILTLLDFHQDGYGPSVGSDGFPAWMTLTGGATNNHAGFPAYYVSDPAVQAAFQSFWQDSAGPGGVGLQQRDAEMFAATARRFARSRSVVGYDVMNEPWPGTTWLPCLSSGGCPTLVGTELDPFYARILTAVRSVDRTHLVMAEPFVLFNFGQSPATVALPGGDPATGLSFHQYATTPAAEVQVIDHALAWSQRTGGALLDTEWGATTSASAITRQADELDQALVPWIFWTFDEDIVANLQQPPSGANLHASTVAALVRPHPLAVAGTPTQLSYDASSRTLGFSWSTVGPDGGRFPRASVTSIQVPQASEPGGYSVQVSGAKVTSRPCAPLLTMEATPGAMSASVTVSPGGACR